MAYPYDDDRRTNAAASRVSSPQNGQYAPTPTPAPTPPSPTMAPTIAGASNVFGAYQAQQPTTTTYQAPTAPINAVSQARPQLASEREDLLKEAENAFYGGGQVQPPPSPTPSPTPAPRSATPDYSHPYEKMYGYGSALY